MSNQEVGAPHRGREVSAEILPPRSVDPETAALLDELSNLQSWCVMMTRKDSGGLPAADLVQRTRIHLIERCKVRP